MNNQIIVRHCHRRGFTLIELLLVLAILGVLAGIIVPQYNGHGTKARIAAATAQIAIFKTTLSAFEIDNGGFPTGRSGLQELVEPRAGATNWKGPYITEIPLDPWEHAYIYEYPGKHHPASFDIVSMGPDGRLGTDDDITNWTMKQKP